MLQDIPKLGKKVAGRAGDAKQVRHLADDGDIDETFNEAPHNWCRYKAGHPSHAEDSNDKKKIPISTARVEVNESNSAVPWVATAPTVNAEISPVAVSGPTTSCRDVPSSA
jgi:hypothetical protein